MTPDFADNVAARLHWASALPTPEAAAHLRRSLEDASWTTAPEAWWTASNRVAFRSEEAWTYEMSGVECARALQKGALTEQPWVHLSLQRVVESLLHCGRHDVLAELVGWFCEKGGPADAPLACDHFAFAWTDTHPALRTTLVPLVGWLVKNASAELRQARRANTLRHMCDLVAKDAPELLLTVLRLIMMNERPSSCVSWGFDGRFGTAWDVIEAAGELGASIDFLVGLASACAPWQSWSDTTARHPWVEPMLVHSRAVLNRVLHQGAVTEGARQRLWQSALLYSDPERRLIHALSSEHLLLLLDELRHVGPGTFAAEDPESAVDRRRIAWVRLVVGEYLRRFDLDEHVVRRDARPNDTRTLTPRWILTQFAGNRRRSLGLALALRDLIAEDRFPGDVELARQLLSPDRPAPGFVEAALATLPTGRPSVTASAQAKLGELRAIFAKLIHHPWYDPVFGVDVRRAFGAATRVEFRHLTNDDKVQFEGELLLVDQAVVEQLAAIEPAESRLQLAALYLAHEVVHIVQGVGDKAKVARLRIAGGETTLMHIDLAADHTAAGIVASVFTKWSLIGLKDVQGSSMGLYPVGWMHPAAARARKAVRLVSARSDLLVRRFGGERAARLGDGYGFVDFGPGGGEFLVFSSGPVVKLLHAAALSNGEAVALLAAADAAPFGTAVSEVDRLVGDLLKRPDR